MSPIRSKTLSIAAGAAFGSIVALLVLTRPAIAPCSAEAASATAAKNR